MYDSELIKNPLNKASWVKERSSVRLVEPGESSGVAVAAQPVAACVRTGGRWHCAAAVALLPPPRQGDHGSPMSAGAREEALPGRGAPILPSSSWPAAELSLCACCTGEAQKWDTGSVSPGSEASRPAGSALFNAAQFVTLICGKSTVLSHAQLTQTPFLSNCFLSECPSPYADV